MKLKKNVICTFCLAKCIRKGQKIVPFDYMTFKRTLFVLLALQNASEKDKKIVPFDYMKNGSLHKKSIFLFLSECHLSRKKVICTFCLAKCIRKGQNNCSFWLHEEWLSPQKEQLLCSFLNVIFLEKNVICTFCLAKCIIKGKKKCSFWLHDVQKERYLYFFSLQNASEKDKKLFLLTTWRSKRTLFVLLALQNASEKDKKIVPFDYMKNGSLHKKSIFLFLSECLFTKRAFFVPFWMSSF